MDVGVEYRSLMKKMSYRVSGEPAARIPSVQAPKRERERERERETP